MRIILETLPGNRNVCPMLKEATSDRNRKYNKMKDGHSLNKENYEASAGSELVAFFYLINRNTKLQVGALKLNVI